VVYCRCYVLSFDTGLPRVPKILCNVPDTQESILRPEVLDVTRQIFANTAIPKEAQIFFPGDLERGQQSGASINHKDPETTKYPSTQG
jgi:hypothetical protein